jgi:hypothetical protein
MLIKNKNFRSISKTARPNSLCFRSGNGRLALFRKKRNPIYCFLRNSGRALKAGFAVRFKAGNQIHFHHPKPV